MTCSAFFDMIKRPLNSQFQEAVLSGRKFTTIRSKPWPCWQPIMLYHWAGKPYKSKHINVAPIEVEEVLEITVTHDRDGSIVFDRCYIDGKPIHETEGFDDVGQMQEWFSKVIKVGNTETLSLMRFHLLNDKS